MLCVTSRKTIVKNYSIMIFTLSFNLFMNNGFNYYQNYEKFFYFNIFLNKRDSSLGGIIILFSSFALVIVCNIEHIVLDFPVSFFPINKIYGFLHTLFN